MPNRILAIGDIHGCPKALAALMEAIQPDESDTVVTLGDYVDRGSDSRGVIDLLLEWRSKTRLVPLLGNHESMMLSALDGGIDSYFWLECGGRATRASYGGDLSSVPDAHREFLKACQMYYETDDCIFIHANYVADLDVHEQPERISLWEHISYTTPPPHKSGKRVIVGHTPQPDGEICDLGHLVCIDTFCVGGKWLTAFEPRTETVWQADKLGNIRSKEA